MFTRRHSPQPESQSITTGLAILRQGAWTTLFWKQLQTANLLRHRTNITTPEDAHLRPPRSLPPTRSPQHHNQLRRSITITTSPILSTPSKTRIHARARWSRRGSDHPDTTPDALPSLKPASSRRPLHLNPPNPNRRSRLTSTATGCFRCLPSDNQMIFRCRSTNLSRRGNPARTSETDINTDGL